MNTTDQPTPEPGWRTLDVGEVIQEGAWQREWIRDDQWTEWHKATHWIGSQVPDSEEMQFRIRRLPSQPETPSTPPDALPPKDEAQGETLKTVEWIRCPVCGEADMRCETIDDVGRQLVYCVNHDCTSNNGSNATVILKEPYEYIDHLQRALAAAEGERAAIEQHLEIARQSIEKVRDAGPKEISGLAIWLIMESVMKQRDAALAELQALKGKPLPVPQTPQEHIEDVMESSFNRGCG